MLNQFQRPVFSLAIGLALAFAGDLRGAEPRVDLIVLTDDGALSTDARAWSELLNRVGFSSVRLRSGGETPAIQSSGTTAAPVYRVVGALSSSNHLVLPYGKFGLNDRGPLEEWLKRLREGGEEAITYKPAAFGLLPKQLVAVHEALTVTVESPTLGKQPREVAKSIADRLPLKFIADDAAQRALASEEPVGDELQGLSSGTALAAVLRPLGLVMLPEKNGADLRLRIATSQSAKEHWPIGWPPKGNPSETLPELFKFLKVEIDNTPLAEAMSAIAGRVKAPILLDHNSLAAARVDTNTPVSLPAASTFYARALDRLLFQAKLKYELRVDEAGKPLIWVTTLRQ